MTVNQSWSEFYQVDNRSTSKGERVFSDVILFISIYDELVSLILKNTRAYLRMIKSNTQKEHKMIESQIVRFVINDIISTEEYTLDGIAYYTNTSKEVVYDVATGSNTDPSLSLSRKVIELHRLVKPELYKNLMSMIINSRLGECEPEI